MDRLIPAPRMEYPTAVGLNEKLGCTLQLLEGKPGYKKNYGPHEPFPHVVVEGGELSLDDAAYNALVEEALSRAKNLGTDPAVTQRAEKFGLIEVQITGQDGSNYCVTLDPSGSCVSEVNQRPPEGESGMAQGLRLHEGIVYPRSQIGHKYGKIQASARLWQHVVDHNESLPENLRFNPAVLKELVESFCAIRRNPSGAPVGAIALRFYDYQVFQSRMVNPEKIGIHEMRKLIDSMIKLLVDEAGGLGVETRWDATTIETAVTYEGSSYSVNLQVDPAQVEKPSLSPQDQGSEFLYDGGVIFGRKSEGESGSRETLAALLEGKPLSRDDIRRALAGDGRKE